MKDFLHNCKPNTNSDRKELERKSGEHEFTTKKGLVIAKEIDYDLGDATKRRFLVATYLGSLYDPDGGYSNRESKLDIQLKSTNETAFANYVKYIETHNRLNFIAAERSFLNGN
jgi:hypothetical protein